ncbi:alpha-hydroxy-acid oxidizing protein [Burkholderia metallica]|uniref:alpha-hydroxy acid oxidase n=1 Tax=Burkholderia metallica TaxID=488729 RepID=UPI00157776F9|nr:alpha-hydroxy acid oxidase [Burkholderia metallica]NTZ06464.1 alpha-hydroxy-acid oxidizing protein [Burkholderia metallica]NTZ85948.1 alpha-hydroxy-acid oxidizing protein [Burkholderia metallica]
MLACVDDYRTAAQRRLARIAWDYLEGAAEDGDSMRAARDSYGRWQFRPRVMADVSACSQVTALWDREAAAPMIVGPTGLNGLFWPKADELLAAAAAEAGLPFVVSTAATSLLEDVRTAAPDADLWLQLYVQRDRAIAEDMMRRANEAGFSTLVLTVDTPVHGNRDHDVRNGFRLPLRPSVKLMLDCMRHPRWSCRMLMHGVPQLRNIAKSVGETENLDRHAALLSRQMDLALQWTDLAWIRRHWRGRVIVKGILGVEDAMLARDAGADGIVLSNHGGRQLASAPAPLDLLPRVHRAVGGDLCIFVDGGVRRGTDVVKAISLGATAVFLGRAPLYGLAARGKDGVAHVLALMKSEMNATMKLLGRTDVASLDRDCVQPAAMPRAGTD